MSWKNNFSWKKNPAVAALNIVGVIAVIFGVVFINPVPIIVAIALFIVAYLVKNSRDTPSEEVVSPKKKKR